MLKKNIIIALILCVIVLTSCSPRTGPPAMSLEFNGRTTVFSTNIYSYFLSHTKTNFLIEMFSLIGVTSIAEMASLHQAMPPLDDANSALIQEQAERNMRNMLALIAYCREHDLTLSQEQINGVDDYIRGVIEQVFRRSRSEFNNTLRAFGINEDILRQIRRYELMAGLVHRHLFDEETGTRRIPREAIVEVYEDAFVRFKHIVITTQAAGNYDVDGNLIEFTPEEVAFRVARAQDIYTRVRESGNDAALFEQLMASYSEDNMPPDGYTISEDTGLIEILTQPLFDMATGEVRLIETDESIHILKKYELLPPEEALDIAMSIATGSPVSIAQVLTTEFRRLITANELAPFLENITVHEEETQHFSARTSDVMFGIWGWLEGRQ